MRRALATAGLLVLLLVALASPTAALAAHPRASFNDIESEVMCDTCNVPLNIAESPRADQERKEIRDLIAQGLTKSQIKATLKARYGPAILALPEDKGFGLAVYLVPIAVVAALLAGAALVAPRWRRRTRLAASMTAPAAGAPELSAADARRLDEDLARYDV
jgi:cytochrome c-type biogenesis protein CcmH/NrfF